MMGVGAFAILFASTFAAAQAPQVVRIRATIDSVDGQVLSAKGRDGAAMKIKVAEKAPVAQIVKASLDDVTTGAYIAVTAMPQPDGSQKALAIYIFPQGVHPPDGFRPWDYSTGSTMTNATVADQVTAASGKTLTVKYKDGEKTIIVTPDTVIATAKKASMADLKPGQKIFSAAAKRLDDGSYEVPNLSFGDYGVWR